MATEVIKRDGSKQPFDEGKIRKSIEAACQDAGLAPEKTDEVVSKVLPSVLEVASAKEEVATSEIADAVLAGLETADSMVAEAWRKHIQNKSA
ncbi:MAG: ATP cone domain-containing protein [bacterium]|nr:ATP cone domain-containing protein [bacterium]